MSRFHAVAVSDQYPDGEKPFTAAEETARTAEEAEYNKLAQVRARKLKALKRLSQQKREEGEITVSSSVGNLLINTDQEARSLVFGAKLGGKPSRKWVKKDGSAVTLTQADVNLIADGVGDFIQGVFDNHAALSGSVKSAKSKAALNAIDIKAGWPS